MCLYTGRKGVFSEEKRFVVFLEPQQNTNERVYEVQLGKIWQPLDWSVVDD